MFIGCPLKLGLVSRSIPVFCYVIVLCFAGSFLVVKEVVWALEKMLHYLEICYYLETCLCYNIQQQLALSPPEQ